MVAVGIDLVAINCPCRVDVAPVHVVVVVAMRILKATIGVVNEALLWKSVEGLEDWSNAHEIVFLYSTRAEFLAS